MLDVGGEVVEHGAEVAVLIEMRGAIAAGLHDDDQREGLFACVLLEADGLRDAVVGEDEVIGLQGVHKLTRAGADERGNDDKAGADGDGCWGRGCNRLRCGGSLAQGGGGEQRDAGESCHAERP